MVLNASFLVLFASLTLSETLSSVVLQTARTLKRRPTDRATEQLVVVVFAAHVFVEVANLAELLLTDGALVRHYARVKTLVFVHAAAADHLTADVAL